VDDPGRAHPAGAPPLAHADPHPAAPRIAGPPRRTPFAAKLAAKPDAECLLRCGGGERVAPPAAVARERVLAQLRPAPVEAGGDDAVLVGEGARGVREGGDPPGGHRRLQAVQGGGAQAGDLARPWPFPPQRGQPLPPLRRPPARHLARAGSDHRRAGPRRRAAPPFRRRNVVSASALTVGESVRIAGLLSAPPPPPRIMPHAP
jgi:hypothetical protein